MARPKRFYEAVTLTLRVEKRELEFINNHKLDRYEIFKRGLKLSVPDDTTAIEMEFTRAKEKYLSQKIKVDELKKEMNILNEQWDEAEVKKGERERLEVDLLYDFLSEQKDPFRLPPWSEDDCGINGWFERKGCPLSFGEVLKMWKEVIE